MLGLLDLVKQIKQKKTTKNTKSNKTKQTQTRKNKENKHSKADNASANERVVHAWFNDLEMATAQKHFSVCIPNNGKDRVTLHSLSECQSHQTFLHQSNQLLVHIAPILSRTYGEAAFLANGHYWLRLCLAWSQFCRAVPLTLRRVSAAPILSQSAASMVEYLSRWNKHHENKTVLDGNSRTKS